MRFTNSVALFLLLICQTSVSTSELSEKQRQRRPPTSPEQQAAREAAAGPNSPRPIDMLDTVWIEEMTWMEVRDSLKAGKTTVIIGSGGLEKNGPYIPTGKHNYVLRTTTEAIARIILGDIFILRFLGFCPLKSPPLWNLIGEFV